MVCRQKYAIPPYSYSKSNRQAALVLLHSDWATTNAEPMAPHIVSVGALTAAPAKALPSDLEDFVQSAGEHGVVYASLGTTAIPGLSFCSDVSDRCACGPFQALQAAQSSLVRVWIQSGLSQGEAKSCTRVASDQCPLCHVAS